MLVVSLCLPCDELAACAGSRNSPQVMEIGPSGVECRKSDDRRWMNLFFFSLTLLLKVVLI